MGAVAGQDLLTEAAAEESRLETAGTAVRPLVSVIVLNFNGEPIIGRCLDHLMAQTFADFEVIVVDNNSADRSVEAARRYLECGKLSIVRSSRNLGVPGGRNLGLSYARGEFVAFIDNDGYAHPNWLAAAVRRLRSDGSIGAVAPVVFFAGRKIILNACGGTMNRQGYGGDCCYQTPYEFAELPREVLHPMGCGMVLRTAALRTIGRFDPLPVKWCEDLEAGIRLWCKGYKVVVEPEAWVDHACGSSDEFLPNRTYMGERARIRTVLKYYPAHRLPAWMVREIRHEAALSPTLHAQLKRAWLWNVRHLPSALGWRLRTRHKARFWNLLDPSWGFYPPPLPMNHECRPDLREAKHDLRMDGKTELCQLNFGWYEAERDHDRTFRWTARQGSVLFRLRTPMIACTVAFRSAAQQEVRLIIRPAASIAPLVEQVFEPRKQWDWRTFPIHLQPGDYELLLLCRHEYREPKSRRLGLAVSSIHFE